VQALSSGPSSSNSGIDWRAMFHSIRNRYATRLEVLQSVLAEDAPPESAFVLLQTLLAPYRLHSAVARSNSSDTAWAAPVFRMCATADTLFADSEPVQATLTASERLLLTAARETSREICRTLVGMWAAGVRDSASLSSGSRLTRRWRAAVDRLMDWLGWAAWTTCRPACVFPVRVFPLCVYIHAHYFEGIVLLPRRTLLDGRVEQLDAALCPPVSAVSWYFSGTFGWSFGFREVLNHGLQEDDSGDLRI
jgi:hypothetical protein